MINKYNALKSVVGIVFMLLNIHVSAQAPPDISLVFYLEESSENGTLVGTVSATDPDGDPLTFSIVSGNDAGAFAIGSTTGDVSVSNNNQLDFDATPTFSLMVEANDGNGGVIVADISINLIETPLGLSGIDGVQIYPNPVAEVLSMEVNGEDVGKLSITLHTLDGKQTAISPQIVSKSKIEMDLSSIKTGIYLLEISGLDNMFIQKRIFVR